MDKLSFGDLVGISEHLSNEELKTIRPVLDITSEEYRNLQRNRCNVLEERIKKVTGASLERLLKIYEEHASEIRINLRSYALELVQSRNLILGRIEDKVFPFLNSLFVLNIETSLVNDMLFMMVSFIVDEKGKQILNLEKTVNFSLKDFQSLFDNDQFLEYLDENTEIPSFRDFLSSFKTGSLSLVD